PTSSTCWWRWPSAPGACSRATRSWRPCAAASWRPSTVPSTCTSAASAARSRPTARTPSASSRFAASATSSPSNRIEAGVFGQRLYLRIWLAVVAAVTVLTLVVGWLWQQALERDRAEREARVTRTIVVENAAGDLLGTAPARAQRIPGEGWRFEVVMNDGEKLYVMLPRPNRPPGGPTNPGSRAPAWLLTPAGF